MNEEKVPSYAVYDEKYISGFFGPYRFLSNFYMSKDLIIKYRGLPFYSVEAAYQAAKCKTLKQMLDFSHLSPSDSKRLGKSIDLRPDWEMIKEGAMFYLVFQKFSDNKELREKLLGTGSKVLVEANNWNDKYWGMAYKKGEDSQFHSIGGENRLGNILMTTRSLLLEA